MTNAQQTVEHLSNLMDRARSNGDVELYCDLQAQLASVLLMLKRSVARTWDAAHNALMNGSWSLARLYLDDLAETDNRDELASLEAYEEASGKTVHAAFRALLEDRIELVNAKASR